MPVPEQKLRLVQDACAEIDACIKRHHSRRGADGDAEALCADDLIPILAYALVSAELPDMLVELKHIEAFLPQVADGGWGGEWWVASNSRWQVERFGSFTLPLPLTLTRTPTQTPTRTPTELLPEAKR